MEIWGAYNLYLFVQNGVLKLHQDNGSFSDDISISIEQNKKYISLAKKRLTKTKSLKDEIVSIAQSRKDLPKVPFGELVEQGIIPPGAVLTDKKEKYKATVTVDGSLKINNISGSIHKVGATIQGLSNCNGWDFWHIKNKSTSILLDEVRDKYRNKK